jgi:hypothetical protein
MEVSYWQILLVLVIVFGFIGVGRGPWREIWTLGCMIALAFLVYVGHNTILEQLPVHLVSAVQSFAGDQNASTETSKHLLEPPWTGIVWLLCVGGAIWGAYQLGGVLGKDGSHSFPESVASFAMGAVSGTIIASLIASQNFLAAIHLQLPNGDQSRNTTVVLVMILAIIALLALVMRPGAKKS